MKLLSLPLKRVKPSPKNQLVTGIVLGVLFAVSAFCLAYYRDISLVIPAAGCPLLLFPFYKFKLYRLFWENPLLYHLFCLLGGFFIGSQHLGFADSPQIDKMMLTLAGGFFFTLFLLELILGVILKFGMDEPRPKNFLKAFAVSFSLLFTALVYLPSETYLNNYENFNYVYLDFAPYIFIRAMIIALVVSLAACAFKPKPFNVLLCLGTGLTLCLYCQYMFMNSDMPSSLGDPVDWDSLKTKAIINAVIWVVILLVPLAFYLITSRIKALKKNKAVQNAPAAAASLIGGIQLLSLIIMLFTTKAALFGTDQYVFSNKEQFVVSSNKNVITFILDMADKKFFDEAYEEDPEKFEFLHDFTYYTNTAMMYDSTILSIPQMLTGTKDLPKDNGYNEWLQNAWKCDSCEEFYKRLHENNYTVNAYGSFGNYNYMPGKVDNCEKLDKDDITINSEELYNSVNDMSAFRYLPLALKKDYEPDGHTINDSVERENECIMDNYQYIDSLKLKKSDTDKNYFIVEHLHGSHYADTAAGTSSSLDLLKKYTDQLKELGVYDDAVIIITADHGQHSAKDNFPIWYIKPANAHNDEMQYSTAPISLTDYLATCLDTAGLKKDGDEELFGRSIYDIKEDEQRERLVFERTKLQFTGTVNGKHWYELTEKGNLFGYYFTGDIDDFVNRIDSGPPDIFIALHYDT